MLFEVSFVHLHRLFQNTVENYPSLPTIYSHTLPISSSPFLFSSLNWDNRRHHHYHIHFLDNRKTSVIHPGKSMTTRRWLLKVLGRKCLLLLAFAQGQCVMGGSQLSLTATELDELLFELLARILQFAFLLGVVTFQFLKFGM